MSEFLKLNALNIILFDMLNNKIKFIFFFNGQKILDAIRTFTYQE